jgi:Cu(I)/Ag(I) efflux system protein CusF
MKAFAVATLLVLMMPAGTAAQSGGIKSMDGMKMDHDSMSKSDKPQAKHQAAGVVKNVDRNEGTVTLAHGPVASLKWPAMTMSFAVKDQAMLKKLPANKKVEFEFVQQGRNYVITDVK